MIQLQFLNYLLSSRDASIITTKGITVQYFSSYKNEFNFIYNHFKKYNSIPDTATFLSTFPEFDIIEVNEPVDYLLSELYRDYNQNYLVVSFNKMRELLQSNKVEEAMDLFQRRADNVSSNRHLEAVNILEDTSRYDEYIDKCENFNKYYIPTGFKELDDSIGGIDRRNSYFVFSGRPGMGKTLILIQCALAAVNRGLKVGFYEGEMTVNKIAGRFDTLNSHLSSKSITRGNSDIALQYKKYLDRLKSEHKGSLFILTKDNCPDGKATINALEGFVDKYELDILFIDQISLLDVDYRFSKSFEQVAELSKQIKNLQVKKHIPIVVASQQNRNAVEEGKTAGTENLSQSDRIGQDATEVVFITKSDEGIVKLSIAKARDGCSKYNLNYKVDFDKGIFTYIPDEDEVESSLTDVISDYNPDLGEDIF